MSDPAPTSAVSATKSPKKASAKAKKSDHPPYKAMVVQAIEELKDRNGSSRHKILKFIEAKFKVKKEVASKYLRVTLKQGVSNGTFEQVKGSFKLSQETKEAAKTKKKAIKKKTAAKPKPKKPAAKKAVTKKAASKKAKSPAKKSSGKKTTTKKAGAKKSTAKKAAAKKPAKVQSKGASKKKPTKAKKTTKKSAAKKGSPKKAKK